MLSQPELLSPAGNLETLKYAVLYGADAVYCALQEFGMRAAPANFTPGQLAEGCIFAHARGKKVYLTLNTLPTNDELARLPQAIRVALPPLFNDLINLFKMSSLAFLVGVRDVMGEAKIQGTNTFHFFESYACVMLIYWIITLIMTAGQKYLEKRCNAIY